MKQQELAKQIRNFGLFVGLVCLALGVGRLFRHPEHQLAAYLLLAASAYFLAGGLLAQGALRPVFDVWMKVAGALGWFNTRVLLGLLFFFVFAPVSFVQRLLGRDALKLGRATDPSLWVPRPAVAGDKNRYYRQF